MKYYAIYTLLMIVATIMVVASLFYKDIPWSIGFSVIFGLSAGGFIATYVIDKSYDEIEEHIRNKYQEQTEKSSPKQT